MSTSRPTRIPISNEAQLAQGVLEARLAAARVGLHGAAAARLGTAVSELTRNILKYAGRGELRLTVVDDGKRTGVEARVSDRGPGIADLDAALSDHFSTGGTLGLGLPGVKRMVDDFDIQSTPGAGTTVTVRMWTR